MKTAWVILALSTSIFVTWFLVAYVLVALGCRCPNSVVEWIHQFSHRSSTVSMDMCHVAGTPNRHEMKWTFSKRWWWFLIWYVAIGWKINSNNNSETCRNHANIQKNSLLFRLFRLFGISVSLRRCLLGLSFFTVPTCQTFSSFSMFQTLVWFCVVLTLDPGWILW